MSYKIKICGESKPKKIGSSATKPTYVLCVKSYMFHIKYFYELLSLYILMSNVSPSVHGKSVWHVLNHENLTYGAINIL